MRDISTAFIKSNVLKDGQTLAQKQLEMILDTDIHKKSLGCKISNTHIRIGKVHLDTFYEAQLLFGNAYWTDIFAAYLYRLIIHKVNEIQMTKERPIVIYGYETYSSLTLSKVVSFLERKGYNANIRIYEVKGEHIRYCDKDGAGVYDKELLQHNPLVFFFVGISSTLSTFSQMDKALTKNNSLYSKVDKYCASVIQVVGNEIDVEDSNDPSKDFLELGHDSFGRYVKSNIEDSYLSFIKGKGNQKAYYYVWAKSGWHKSDDCHLCVPENYKDEYPLVEVNEASVVPTQMIRLNQTNEDKRINDPVEEISRDNSSLFINDLNNREYLYYDHIERNGNHHQYYFRLSRLYHDKKDQIENWLKKVKQSKYASEFLKDKTVNVIVAPQHFSNTGYVNSVNSIIFDGKAHIIEFDINKEFRSNFKAKYNNYCELENIISDLRDYTINFYYVNDQIVSGETFYRAKSLINSLFSEHDKPINVFRGIFVLLDRNSFETRKNYVDILNNKDGDFYLPYFTYVKIDIPSLRSYNDSCPICYNINKAFEIMDECALDETVYYWQEKVVYHREKNISEIREITKDDEISLRHFRRLQAENDLWISVKESYKQISDHFDKQPYEQFEDTPFFKRDLIIENFMKTIGSRTSYMQEDIKVEYLISYLKVMSRALIFYQEDVKKAVMRILLDLLDLFLTYPEKEQSKSVGGFQIDINKCSKIKQYDLFRCIIACLCNIGSCAILRKEIITSVWLVGNKLFEESKNKKDIEPFLIENIKKLLCYDRGDSKAKLLNRIISIREITKDDSKSRFFLKLYLENTRIGFLHFDFAPAIIEFNYDDASSSSTNKGYDINKYKSLANNIKSLSDDKVSIAFFAESGNEYINITENEMIPPKQMKNSFSLEDDRFYISIGNNYSKLEKLEGYDSFQLKQVLKDELKLIKNAKVIMAIETKEVSCIADILKYRKYIQKAVETDFNNDAIPSFISLHDSAEMLAEVKTVTHRKQPLRAYETIYKNINNMIYKDHIDDEYKYILNDFLSIYMDTVISIAYREMLGKDYGFSSFGDNLVLKSGWNPVQEKLDYARDMIKTIYSENDIHLSVGYMGENGYVQYAGEEKDNVIKMILKDYEIARFRRSNEVVEPYLIIKTFIDNALEHCLEPVINVRLVKEYKGDDFNLEVENTAEKLKDSTTSNHITLKALECFFNGRLHTSNHEKMKMDDDSVFKIVLEKFIIKKGKRYNGKAFSIN